MMLGPAGFLWPVHVRDALLCQAVIQFSTVHSTVHSKVQYSNCGRGSQTLVLASEPQAHEGAQRAQ
jgi:hypothetical protein